MVGWCMGAHAAAAKISKIVMTSLVLNGSQLCMSCVFLQCTNSYSLYISLYARKSSNIIYLPPPRPTPRPPAVAQVEGAVRVTAKPDLRFSSSRRSSLNRTIDMFLVPPHNLVDGQRPTDLHGVEIRRKWGGNGTPRRRRHAVERPPIVFSHNGNPLDCHCRETKLPVGKDVIDDPVGHDTSRDTRAGGSHRQRHQDEPPETDQQLRDLVPPRFGPWGVRVCVALRLDD